MNICWFASVKLSLNGNKWYRGERKQSQNMLISSVLLLSTHYTAIERTVTFVSYQPPKQPTTARTATEMTDINNYAKQREENKSISHSKCSLRVPIRGRGTSLISGIIFICMKYSAQEGISDSSNHLSATEGSRSRNFIRFQCSKGGIIWMEAQSIGETY